MGEGERAVSQDVHQATWVAAAAAGGIVIGSLGPWATAPFGVSKAGTEGDGVFTLILAVVAGVILLKTQGRTRNAPIGLMIIGAISLVVGIIDINDVNEKGSTALAGEEVDVVDVGWGLWLVTIGGAVLTAAGFVLRRLEPND